MPLKIVFILANSVDPDEMPPSSLFAKVPAMKRVNKKGKENLYSSKMVLTGQPMQHLRNMRIFGESGADPVVTRRTLPPKLC